MQDKAEHIEKLSLEAKPFNKVLQHIMAICPACVQNGTIDFERLRTELAEYTDSNTREIYEFSWVGKKDSIVEANTPSNNTLRPCKEESINWATTENIYIEGDNLEVLKLLHESYLNKIKLIYIDPPYNTGNDLIYKDKFKQGLEKYEESQFLLDAEGNRLFKNTETNGRFHSDWCSMIYPRLKIARNLLKEDGLICISIDDNEAHNLRKICDEIFGEDNFINQISVKMSEMKGAKLAHVNKRFPKIKEYLFIYAKNKDIVRFNPINEPKKEHELKKYVKYYNKYIVNKEENIAQWRFEPFKGEYEDKIKHADTLIYLVAPDQDKKVDIDEGCFAESINTLGETNYFYNDRGSIKKVLFLSDNLTTYLGDLWLDISTININKENYEIPTYTNGQKPLELLNTILSAIIQEDSIILDFFAGSGTLGDAVLRFNHERSMHNSFILVQVPEKIEITSGMDNEVKKATTKMLEFLQSINKEAFLTEIGKERLRRACEKIQEMPPPNSAEGALPTISTGFRVLKLDSSNMKEVYFTTADMHQSNLLDSIENIKPDRSPLDLLFSIMLSWGITLNLPIHEEKIASYTIYTVGDKDLIACFDTNITDEVIKHMAQLNPLRVIFRDACFNDKDDAKINMQEIFKTICSWDEKKAKANIRVI